MKRLLLALFALVFASPLVGQTMDTTVVKVRDSVKVPVTYPVYVYRDSVFDRDSLVITPKPDTTPTPPPPDTTSVPGSNEPAGFKVLGHVVPIADNDKGDGPVPLGSGDWVGQMTYDAGTHLTPFPSAIRWHYRDGCWGGSSPGYAWFENGMANQNVHTVYTRGWYRVSSNWLGHVVGTKIALHGWGTNGNQQILYLRGSGGTVGGTLRMGWSWQGAGTLPTSAIVGGLGGLDPNGGNFSVYGGIFPRDKWVKVETLSYAAPQGTLGSWAKIWLDGVLVAHVANFDAARVTETRLNAYKLAPVWGGGTSCTAPGGQNLWLANVYVSGK